MIKGKYIRTPEIREKCKLSKIGEKNPRFGKHLSKKARKRLSKQRLAEKNPMWKGDNVKGKDTFHEWLKRKYPAPEFCEKCHKKKKLDLASINGHKYTRNIKDYKWLCRSCHFKLDKIIKNLK